MSLGPFAQKAQQCLKKQANLRHLNAFVPSITNTESILRNCQEADTRHDQGKPLSPLDGQLIAIKDNICTKDQPTTCASAMLQGYNSPFSATVVERLQAAGAVIAGKANLDEFGMGSHSINSVHGAVTQPGPEPDIQRTVGGSSGGSALAVASEQCFAALGTDTGGSVRLPAAWTGTVGFKPSYGMVSRWGVVAYANSLDTVGVIASNVASARNVYNIVKGHDSRDPTSISTQTRARIQSPIQARDQRRHIRPIRIGIPNECFINELHPSIQKSWMIAVQHLNSQGHSLLSVPLPTTKAALSAYYVLAPAEASSNLAKYDGVRYGNKVPPSSTTANHDPEAARRQGDDVLFSQTRGQNFGAEVRRRILLGSYTLSSTAIDNYFIRAQKVRRMVQKDFDNVFALPNSLLCPSKENEKGKEGLIGSKGEVDVIITPTATRPAPLLSELRSEEADMSSPARRYCDDVYTVPASLAGLPAISVPVPLFDGEKERRDEPSVGVQITGQYGDDELVLSVAEELE
ncbi:MAG: hypothetical protein Q9203_005405, partial [Teloschistes exilis]